MSEQNVKKEWISALWDRELSSEELALLQKELDLNTVDSVLEVYAVIGNHVRRREASIDVREAFQNRSKQQLQHEYSQPDHSGKREMREDECAAFLKDKEITA